MSQIITRFAPSPTGFLHLGGARTALFNWLYAKRHNGQFLIRIENTDNSRSLQHYTDSILSGLKWMGLNHDKEIVFQDQQIKNHLEIGNILLKKGFAYKTTNEETGEAIRFKTPKIGFSTFQDEVCGEIKVQNSQIEDFVLIRSNGSPTYNLAVVADDIYMQITHIIRGSDHIANTIKQVLIYDALQKKRPVFAHIPLIHAQDGTKLSKRHGALDINEYKREGFLPDALSSYLVRLGWSTDNDAIISKEQAKSIFSLKDVGNSPSRFDINKLKNINNYYMRKSQDIEREVLEFLDTDFDEKKLKIAIPVLIKKSYSLKELASFLNIYIYPKINISQDMLECIDTDILKILLSAIKKNKEDKIDKIIKNSALQEGYKIKNVYESLRIAITGTLKSDSFSDIIDILGIESIISRIEHAITQANN